MLIRSAGWPSSHVGRCAVARHSHSIRYKTSPVKFQKALEASQGVAEEETSTSAPPSHFTILYQDEHFVAIDKPQGVYVHPPEDTRRPCPVRENGMYLLKRQLGGKYLYPVHRLDRATSGVVVYALSSEAAAAFGAGMRARRVQKVYYALVRGYTDTCGVIDLPCGGRNSVTLYETLGRMQLPMAVGKFKSSRYSLLRLEPLTGRYHQLRRHLNYIGHPIVGDSDHGDRYHNRAFLNDLNVPGMFLRAGFMEFDHPGTGGRLALSIKGAWEPRWQSVFDAMGVCPLVPTEQGGADLNGKLAAVRMAVAAAAQMELPSLPDSEIWDGKSHGLDGDSSGARGAAVGGGGVLSGQMVVRVKTPGLPSAPKQVVSGGQMLLQSAATPLENMLEEDGEEEDESEESAARARKEKAPASGPRVWDWSWPQVQWEGACEMRPTLQTMLPRATAAAARP